MKFNIIRRFLSQSKSVPKPPSITFSTDVYQSIHLNLTEKVHSSALLPYVKEILDIELIHNSQHQPNQHTKAIWIHLKVQNLHLIEQLVNSMQFKIHHGKDNYIVLYRWISTLTDLVTPFSMFYISCGAALIKQNSIFLVQERTGARKGKYGIPGGRADFGQTIPGCSERQLFEQTGIKAEFRCLLYLRQMTKTIFNGVDFYFVCLMKWNESSFESLKICERQLSDGRWVPLDQYRKFAQENSFGTQTQVADYIASLYEKGYNFEERMPTEMIAHQYTSPRDKITRNFVEHFMIQEL